MDLQKIKKLVEDGFAAPKIAQMLKCNLKDLKSEIVKNNFALKSETFAEIEKINILDLYERGVSANQLGLKYSIDKRRVQKWADEAGLLRNKSEAGRLNNFNENIFDEINTEEKIYWLGFLSANSYHDEKQYRLNICLRGDDKNHLEKFCNFIEYGISYIKDEEIIKQDKSYFNSSIVLYSKKLSETLAKLGCMQNKSSGLKFPSWIADKELQRSFIRGYFDGAGSIRVSGKDNEWKINILGTEDIIYNIKNVIKEEVSANSSFYETENKTYAIQIAGNIQVLNVAKWFYENCNDNIFMQRKYDQYLLLIEQQANKKKK